MQPYNNFFINHQDGRVRTFWLYRTKYTSGPMKTRIKKKGRVFMRQLGKEIIREQSEVK